MSSVTSHGLRYWSTAQPPRLCNNIDTLRQPSYSCSNLNLNFTDLTEKLCSGDLRGRYMQTFPLQYSGTPTEYTNHDYTLTMGKSVCLAIVRRYLSTCTVAVISDRCPHLSGCTGLQYHFFYLGDLILLGQLARMDRESL